MGICSLSFSNKVREIWLNYKQAEDLINIGAYTKGNNPTIDYAISKIDFIKNILQQGIKEKISFQQVIQELNEKL
jgi:flagellum-specific ATP synthase